MVTFQGVYVVGWQQEKGETFIGLSERGRGEEHPMLRKGEGSSGWETRCPGSNGVNFVAGPCARQVLGHRVP